MSNEKNRENLKLSPKSDGTAFGMFSLWSFVLLCRPQDYFIALSAIRPTLILSVFMLVVMLIYSYRVKGPPYFQEKQVTWYLVLLMTMVASIPTSLYSRLSFNAVFTEYIIVILFFFIFYKVVNSVDRIKRLLLIYCIGSGLYLLFTIIFSGPGVDRISYGSMFDPNDLAFFSLVFMPFNLLFLRRTQPLLIRLFCLATFGASIVVIFLSGSRGGMIAFLLAMAILLMVTSVIRKSTKFCIVLCCLIIMSGAAVNMERYATIFSLEEDYNLQVETGRVAIWQAGMRAMLANPLTGVGVMCFPSAVGLDRERRGAATLAWQAAHNSIVQIGTETGVLGLLVFVMLSFRAGRIFYNIKAESTNPDLVRIAEMGLVGFVGMFTAAMFLSQAYSIYWAFYIVFSATMSQLIAKEKSVEIK